MQSISVWRLRSGIISYISTTSEVAAAYCWKTSLMQNGSEIPCAWLVSSKESCHWRSDFRSCKACLFWDFHVYISVFKKLEWPELTLYWRMTSADGLSKDPFYWTSVQGAPMRSFKACSEILVWPLVAGLLDFCIAIRRPSSWCNKGCGAQHLRSSMQTLRHIRWSNQIGVRRSLSRNAQSTPAVPLCSLTQKYQVEDLKLQGCKNGHHTAELFWLTSSAFVMTERLLYVCMGPVAYAGDLLESSAFVMTEWLLYVCVL